MNRLFGLLLFLLNSFLAITFIDRLISRGNPIGTPVRRYKFYREKGKFGSNDAFMDFRERRLSDISNLSECVNVTELILSSNRITDISPLSSLTGLKRLYLNGNKIEDLSPLSPLSNLEYLDLRDNQIADISALSALGNLEYLDLTDNRVSDISPLFGLTGMRILKLRGNNIGDGQLKELKSVIPNIAVY